MFTNGTWLMKLIPTGEVFKTFKDVDDATIQSMDMAINNKVKIEHVNNFDRVVWVTLIED